MAHLGFVPGAKVTITFQVKLAAGVPADTVVRNTASVTARPDFPSTCTPDNADDAEKIVEGQRLLTSWAEITALAGNSFDGTKWVAGDDPRLPQHLHQRHRADRNDQLPEAGGR